MVLACGFAAAANRRKGCSSLGPCRLAVQPASNTRFEFVLKYSSDLDKIPISQHAGDVLHHHPLASLKMVRFGFGRLNWGLEMKFVTGLLGAVLHDKICVTSHANLGFHAAWDFGANGRAITNPEATQMLYSMYPSPVRRWISQRGGLTPHMIFLRGKQLMGMYKPCYLDAQASSSPRPVSAHRDSRQQDVIAPTPAALARQPD